MASQRLSILLLVGLLMCSVIKCNMVEDFTYSELEVIEQRSSSSRISLTPQRSVLERWQFPNTWQIRQFLTRTLQKQSTLPQISNIDGQISFLKQKVSQFLKLSNKAELLVRNIQQLPQMKNEPLLYINDKEFNSLEKLQANMFKINIQIDAKGVELENIVEELMIQQENPLFKVAALNFEKNAFVQKISLFEQLLSEAQSGKQAIQRKGNDQKLIKYFNQLDTIFQKQSGLIESIDTLLKNHNQLTILKARVTSLSSQLKAHQLTLAEKQECSEQFKKIKQKQAHDRQVIKLIQTLKQKKLEFNEPNKYCEGVVKKLVDRVKKLLIGYDYVYECAQDLDEVRGNRDKIQSELNEAQRKFDELQLSKGVEEFRKNFQSNRTLIANKVKELQTLQLDDFYRYPNAISYVITQSQHRIAQIQQTLANIPAKSRSDLTQIQHHIIKKVSQIKSLKAQYCKENELYTQISSVIEERLTELQQQEEYNAWVRNVEIEKFEELQAIKREMKEIEVAVFEYLAQGTQ